MNRKALSSDIRSALHQDLGLPAFRAVRNNISPTSHPGLCRSCEMGLRVGQCSIVALSKCISISQPLKTASEPGPVFSSWSSSPLCLLFCLQFSNKHHLHSHLVHTFSSSSCLLADFYFSLYYLSSSAHLCWNISPKCDEQILKLSIAFRIKLLSFCRVCKNSYLASSILPPTPNAISMLRILGTDWLKCPWLWRGEMLQTQK